jgi:hypothetical protein
LYLALPLAAKSKKLWHQKMNRRWKSSSCYLSE